MAFSYQGWKVFLAGRDGAGVEKLVAEIRADGGVSEGEMFARWDVRLAETPVSVLKFNKIPRRRGGE